MSSLRTFHLVFILFAMVVLDLFGFWGIWNYIQNQGMYHLVLGIVGLAGGIGLAVYAFFTVRSFDREGIT